jgi:hypothetical protein
VVRGPLGGLAWHYLQYVLGLAQLGHDVWFIEDADDGPSCYDPRSSTMTRDPAFGIEFAVKVFARLGLADRWAYYDSHTRAWLGPAGRRARRICAEADVVLNVSAINPIRPWLARVPVRVLIDTDPAFTQIQHLTAPERRAFAEAHTAFFTFGENIPRGTSRVPADGLPWQATRQPVVLDQWPLTAAPAARRFTTVMLWNSYPAVEYGGVRYGMKSVSFDAFVDLPRHTNVTLELACKTRARLTRLVEHGWRLRSPRGSSGDPWRYQRFIQGSTAEFSVAKHGYVAANTGWFSERSTAYLASGRPVVVQDTGFSEWLRADAGVVAFSSLEQAIHGIERVTAEYDRHAKAAREVAAAFFDSRPVLTSLLGRAGC